MQPLTTISSRSLQYYAVARHWMSDLEFFKIETAFLHRLMDGYFVRLTAGDRVKGLVRAGKKLLELEKQERQLNQMLDLQLTHLELMAEDVIPEDIEELEGKQVQLEKLVGTLKNDYCEVKKELFVLVQEVMREANDQQNK